MLVSSGVCPSVNMCAHVTRNLIREPCLLIKNDYFFAANTQSRERTQIDSKFKTEGIPVDVGKLVLVVDELFVSPRSGISLPFGILMNGFFFAKV